MASVLPFDELNRFNEDLRKRYGTEKLKTEDLDDIIDEMLDLFLLAYAQKEETFKFQFIGEFCRPTGATAATGRMASPGGKLSKISDF